jgi:polyhydroxyalkanoate synthesis regulator phasin
MKRRPLNVFSLSFIDCICCGLGAIILLFVIVNARSAVRRDEITRDLTSEVDRLEGEVLEQRKRMVDLRNALETSERELEEIRGTTRQIVPVIEERREEIAHYRDQTLARKSHADKLKADVRSMEKGVKRLEAGGQDADDYGSKVRTFRGEGNRQYLTDLRVGGGHILILLDASASMLDETIVGIIRRRNLPADQQRSAPKWRKAIATVDWLTAQFPPGSRYQIIVFNEAARFLLPGTDGRWLKTADVRQLNEAVDRLYKIVPEKGTSLANAFTEMRRLRPAPENVFLVTDGLPTMGTSAPWRKKVSGEKRLSLFGEAVKLLPEQIPVNVILFPLEGDPAAASAYWRLAAFTRGAYFCPSPDWP